ncbi:MAG: glycoside hydrolase family 27 protein, partial [Bacteroidota bacterium]|nr:glycoside hydrolase family 27 protein [Bacteroidota bacterium]
TLIAQNVNGEYKREFRIIVGDKLALTPPMGWNSWNVWGLAVDNDKVKASADMFIKSGLADQGYTYVNIDDGWEAPSRDANGEMVTNEKFPDIRVTSDYVHSKGLRFGIYSSPGPKTCGGYLGSYQHELQDAETYAKWGIDYLKYDWCSYTEVCPDAGNLEEQKKPYILISECLKKQPRDIVHSMCQYGMGNVWTWGGSIGGQLWRTTGDIEDTWESLKSIGFYQSIAAPFAKPGNWNDPDMLVVGWVGWGPKLHPTRLTASEQYTHISLWALLSAPMLMGCDLTRIDDFTMNLLGNNEVIDIDQDALGKSAVPVIKDPLYEVWVKQLEDGSKAIGLFNLDKDVKNISIDWARAGLSEKQVVRDIWRQKNLGTFDKSFETKVQPHGVTLIKVTKE